MRKYLLAVLLLVVSQSVLAVTLKVALNYHQPGNKMAIDKTIKLQPANHQWMILSSQTQKNKTLLLLGKLEKADAEQVTMRFVLMNMDRPDVMFEPKIIMNYQQRARVDVRRGNHVLRLSVLALKK